MFTDESFEKKAESFEAEHKIIKEESEKILIQMTDDEATIDNAEEIIDFLVELHRWDYESDEEEKELNKDSSELIANFFFTPKFKDNIKLYLNNMLMKRHINLKLKGKILLDTKNKKVETKITYRDIENISMQENILVNALNNSYTLWDIKGFENYENIIINFVIIMNRKGKKSYGIKVGLLTNSFEQALGLYGLSYNQITNGNKFLSLGIKSIENKEYKKAIEYFTKSFKSNHTLVESLYNRAFCLYKLKEYNKACEDWNILKELGQKKGEKLFKKNCKIIE